MVVGVMRRTKLTRAELHALVWEKPLRTAAKELGISDVGLSKICKRHGVPTPPQGHWTRVQMGKAVTKGKLPPAALGRCDEIDIVGAAPGALAETVENAPCPPEERSRRDALLQRETQAEFSVVVRENPATLHPMAQSVKKALKASRVDDYGCVRCELPSTPTVRVTPVAVPRAVAIVDAFARAADLRRFSWKSGKGGRWDNVASLTIEEIEFSIEIYETVERRVRDLTTEEKAKQARGQLYWRRQYEYVGTNRFCIRRSEWSQYVKDTKNQKVEDRLNELFTILICRAFETREEQRRRAIAEELMAQREARLAEIRRLQSVEKKALEGLHQHVANRRKADDIRALIAAVAGAPGPGIENRRQWLIWAAAYADRIDPLCHGLKQIMDVDFEAFEDLRRMLAEEPGEETWAQEEDDSEDWET